MIQTTLRLPENLHQILKQEAKKRGVTINSMMVMLLWKALAGACGYSIGQEGVKSNERR